MTTLCDASMSNQAVAQQVVEECGHHGLVHHKARDLLEKKGLRLAAPVVMRTFAKRPHRECMLKRHRFMLPVLYNQGRTLLLNDCPRKGLTTCALW